MMTRGHAAAPQWSGAISPAGVGLEHGKRIIEVPQELGRVLLLLLGTSRLEITSEDDATDRTKQIA